MHHRLVFNGTFSQMSLVCVVAGACVDLCLLRSLTWRTSLDFTVVKFVIILFRGHL